jgi:HEPN domain-containing protein
MADSADYSEWTAKGDEDLRVAKHLLSLYPEPIDIICFHCQQAAEKYLKAYLTSKDVAPSKTHELQVLCEKCKTYDETFETIITECIRLTDYGVAPRYPIDHVIELSLNSMQQALKDAEKIINFVGTKKQAK